MKLGLAVIMALLLTGTAFAIHEMQYYDTNIDGYSGQLARDRRSYDPYSRARYFGYDYNKQFINYGSKGPTYRVTNTGAKSAFSSVFNLDTNAFSSRGRDPSKISNWDPNIRGYARLDKSVELLPFAPVDQFISSRLALAKGTARVLSTGDQYGAGLNKPYPRTQIFIQIRNLPPLSDNQIYEAWLVDDQTEYAISMGVMKSGGLTSQLNWEFRRLTHMFERVWITREAFPDIDPSPGEIVLEGSFVESRTGLKPLAIGLERVR